jgi:hypothetical protein
MATVAYMSREEALGEDLDARVNSEALLQRA